MVGAAGDGATFTGDGCHDWAGGVAGDGYAIQGNILAGPAGGRRHGGGLAGRGGDARFAYRLLAALRAGDAAGGDRRGRQSAALLVVAKGMGYGGTSDVVVDLRVDDHPDPVTELARLLDVHALLLRAARPGDADRPGRRRSPPRCAARLAAAGHPSGDGPATWTRPWPPGPGMENLEERMVPGAIDPLVLAQLRAATPAP